MTTELQNLFFQMLAEIKPLKSLALKSVKTSARYLSLMNNQSPQYTGIGKK